MGNRKIEMIKEEEDREESRGGREARPWRPGGQRLPAAPHPHFLPAPAASWHTRLGTA